MKENSPQTINVSSGTIIRVILILILFYVLFIVRDLILVILTAIVLASAIEPGTRWFVRRKIPRVLSVLIIYISITALFVVSFYFLFIPILQESADFLRSLPEYSSAIQSGQKASGGGSLLSGFSESFSLSSIIKEVNEALSNLSSGLLSTVDVVFGGVFSFVLIIVLSFYLAVQEDGVGKFLRIVAPLKHEQYIIGLWKRSKEKIGLWMQGQILLAVIVAVLVFLGLTLIGVRHALLLAVIAGLFELIPLFGAFLAAAPAVAIAFIDGGLTMALVVVGLYIIIQQFESQLIYPLVVKKVVGVPPIISILAIIIGAKIAGFLGIILSVPIAAVLMELLNDFEMSKAKEAKK